MAQDDPNLDQEAALRSLKVAYDTANYALEKVEEAGAPDETIATLNDAADFALRCLVQAMKETLTVNNSITKATKTQLDAVTSSLKEKLKNVANINAVVTDVDQLVKLAGALASAFA